jgi:hypothetical protein
VFGDGLTDEQYAALILEYETLDRAAYVAIERSQELKDVYRSRHRWPEERFGRYFWPRVATVLGFGSDGEQQGSRRGAKTLGIPEREFWWILEKRLEKGERASRKWLARETGRREELTYVPRDRLASLIDWVDAHKESAHQALALRRIPPEFRAGKLGPIPPNA